MNRRIALHTNVTRALRSHAPIALGVTAALMFSACHTGDAALVELPPADSAAATPAALGEVTASAEPIERHVSGSGTLEPSRVVSLSAPYMARIDAVDVTEGDRVDAGDRLVLLDTTAPRLQAAQASASAAATRAQAQLASAEVERLQPLLERGVVTPQQLDQLRAQHAALSESVEASEAMASLSRAQRDDGAIRAPFAGIVTEVPAEVGAMAAPGVPLARLVDLSTVDIRVSLSESDMHAVGVGDPVNVEIVATGETRPGEVRFVDPELDPATRFGEVIVRVDNADGALLAGSFARVTAERRAPRTAIVVPPESLLRTASGTWVYVLGGASPERRAVVAERIGDGRWVIREGVAAGERLATGNLARLSNASAGSGTGEASP